MQSRELKRRNPKIGAVIDGSAGKAAAAVVAAATKALERRRRMFG